MIVIAGAIAVRRGSRAEAVKLIGEVVAKTKPETGCISYDFSVDMADECVFRLFEQWNTPEDLDRHLQAPHTQAFLTAIGTVVSAPPEVRKYVVSSVESI